MDRRNLCLDFIADPYKDPYIQRPFTNSFEFNNMLDMCQEEFPSEIYRIKNPKTFDAPAKFVKYIGSGAQGEVKQYEVDGQLVAVKFFNPGKKGEIKGTALKELNIFKSLEKCAYINQVIDVTVQRKGIKLYLGIMMPFMSMDLTKFTNQFMDLRIKFGKRILYQILTALANLHHIGVIHCDIKPDNILVELTTEGPNIILADFGLSIQLPCRMDMRELLSHVQGSALYMAPELLYAWMFGRQYTYYSDKVDLWSTAITMLEFYRGDVITEPSFDGAGFEDVFFKIMNLAGLPRNMTTIKQFKNESIKSSIPVSHFLPNVEQDVIDVLTKMLFITPTYRAEITDLINTQFCTATKRPFSHHTINDTLISIQDYYDAIAKILDTSISLNLHPATAYMAIHLWECLVGNIHQIANYTVTCVIIMGKLFEDVDALPDPFEIELLEKLNYIISSCETDLMVYNLNHFGNEMKKQGHKQDITKFIYDKLFIMYIELKAQYQYAANLNDTKLLEAFLNANEI